MMNLKYSSPTPPLRKPTPREVLDELIRSGYRAYICGDPGYGVVLIWAKSVYIGAEPDEEATLDRISSALDCDNVKRKALSPALEYLLSSSVIAVSDDFGGVVVRPLDRLRNL